MARNWNFLKAGIQEYKDNPDMDRLKCRIWPFSQAGPFGHTNIWNPEKKKYEALHRAVYYLFHGKEVDNLACHECGVPPCWNPYHIYDGTLSDNAKDKAAHNRMRVPQEERVYGLFWQTALRQYLERVGIPEAYDEIMAEVVHFSHD